jgi:hydroxymethylglutaryl-CoA reductase
MQVINGFSKLSRSEKLAWLKAESQLSADTLKILDTHLHKDADIQEVYGDLSENTVSNYYLPLGLSPNFLINGKMMTLPMVTEESSVVAAASSAAKFWSGKGGFSARVTGRTKVGQVHFHWSGDPAELYKVFERKREDLLRSVYPITRKMEERGGGILSMEIQDTNSGLPGDFQLFVRFDTADAMGANFINSVLEKLAAELTLIMEDSPSKGELEVLMSILSNYTPESLVQCHVEGETGIFEHMSPDLSAHQFTTRFRKAVDIAINDPYRAVTHNKGIFNGMDAVILATGNDFRAVEAGGHAYASRKGTYQSLSSVEISEGSFRFSLEVPLAVGTVGGLTGTHPMAAASLEILGKPSAEELMQIIAAAGLASNFSAVRSLITTGIQQGHMKMHLGNMLRQLNASREESQQIEQHFANRSLSYSELASFLDNLRRQNPKR